MAQRVQLNLVDHSAHNSTNQSLETE